MPVVILEVERLRNIHCGLGQFCLHLSRALLDAADPDWEIVPLLRPAQQALFADRPGRCLPITAWRNEPAASLMRCWIGVGAAREHGDLWHVTHQESRFLPLQRSRPLVLTIHDLNFLREKGPATIRRRLRRLQAKVNRATAITTGSQHAAAEIRQHLELGEKPLEVIPHGICIDPKDAADRRPDFLPPGRFLLAIGDITPKKNFHVLVDLAARLPDYRLVIAGNRSTDYAKQIDERVASTGLGGRVLLPGAVSDAQRVWLYQNCDAFCFPSLSEGFGLPVIEAMSCGRPVFCSDRTSLPEVGGDLAFYWPDFEPGAMAAVFRAGMARAESVAGFRQQLRAHAGKFRWPVAAGRYLELYQRVLADYPARRSGNSPNRSSGELAARASTVRDAA